MPHETGVLVIQIDGLAHRVVERALVQGELPRMGRLLKEGYALSRFRAALPCNTPAGQSAIFYGNNDNIPAFRWIERESRKLIDFSFPDGVRHVEDRLAQSSSGLLARGSSYVNLVTGGSRRAVLTTGAFSWDRWQEKLTNIDVTLALMSNPKLLGSVLRHSNAPLWWEFIQALWASFSQGHFVVAHQYRVIDFVSSILIPALQTAGAALDLKRGLPIIYSNYIGFDEAGHYRGLHTAETLRSLQRIDALIGYLDDRRREAERRYDLVILSDHGMTPSVPFRQLFGLSFSDWVHLLAPEATVLDSSPLSHIYLQQNRRLQWSEMQERHPHLLNELLRHPGIGLVAALDAGRPRLMHAPGHDPFQPLDEPERWRADVERLTRMPDSGDLLIFGRYRPSGTIVNFEAQWAGHGALGGDQGYPFLLVPPHLQDQGWSVRETPDLYPLFQASYPQLF